MRDVTMILAVIAGIVIAGVFVGVVMVMDAGRSLIRWPNRHSADGSV